MAPVRLSLLALAVCLAGCISNQNSLTAVAPSHPASRSADHPARVGAEHDGKGPRLLWHDLNWWVWGIPVPGDGALFSVRNGLGGSVIGVVRVVEPAAEPEGVSRVDWYCRQEQLPDHEVDDSLPIRRADLAELRSIGKCMGDFVYTASAADGEKPAVRLSLGPSAQVGNGDVYDLLTERGDVVGRCGVEKVDVGSTSCSIHWAEPALGKSILRGQAHALTRAPTVSEARRFIQPYTRTWPPGRTEATSVIEQVVTPRERKAAEGSSLDSNQWIALGAWSAGALGLAVGAGMALSAKTDYDDARALCDANGQCDDRPYEEIQSARGRGWVATGMFGVGAAAVGTGFVFWLARPLEPKSRPGSPSSVQIGVGLSAGQLLLRGRI